MKLTEAQFEEQYNPIESPAGSTLWEIAEVIAEGVEINNLWTVTESGDDSNTLYASPGYVLVNRIGYCVTENPWPNTDIEAIYCEGQEVEQ